MALITSRRTVLESREHGLKQTAKHPHFRITKFLLPNIVLFLFYWKLEHWREMIYLLLPVKYPGPICDFIKYARESGKSAASELSAGAEEAGESWPALRTAWSFCWNPCAVRAWFTGAQTTPILSWTSVWPRSPTWIVEGIIGQPGWPLCDKP